MASDSVEPRRRVSFSVLIALKEELLPSPDFKQRRGTMPELPLLIMPSESSGFQSINGCESSCDSGIFSEEEESGGVSREEEWKNKNGKWLAGVVNNIFGDMFKGEVSKCGRSELCEQSLDEFQLTRSIRMPDSSNPFSKDATYYCVSPACQTFGKNKDRIPSKKKYSDGRVIPFPTSTVPNESSIPLVKLDASKSFQERADFSKLEEHHSTVWIQLLPDILPDGEVFTSPPTLQIKHSCSQSAKNYIEVPSNLTQFSESERNTILWYQYLGRQVESDLVKSTDEEETNFLSLKLRHLSRQVCGRCGSGFSMLFNRRLQCSFCQLGVCKNCCKKLTSDGNWICDACTEKQELQRQSCEWFYDHLHKSFNDFGSAKIMKSISHNEHSSKKRASMNENAAQVRDHIEKVVEALIGENIDSVNINRLVNDPQYDDLFKDYHEKLSDALAGLVLAIQLVMENRTIEDENTTPTTAHIKLKNLINQLIIDAGKFKKAIMVTPETLHHSFRPQEEENSYEDLLATAIINKVVTSTRQKFRGQSNKSQIFSSSCATTTALSSSVCDASERLKSLCSVEDDHASSEESGRGASASPSSTPPVRISSSYEEEEDAFSNGSRQYDEIMSNESREDDSSPWTVAEGQQFVIQEEIEEVTTTIYDDQITERIIVRKNPKIRSAASCPTLSSLDTLLPNEDSPDYERMNDSTVPFPELGLDVHNASSQSHPSTGWEENWFFRKQSSQPSNFVKLSALVRLLTDDPVSMLVPNPTEDCRPQIGARDVDEISELSERNSVGSIEFSSSSEEESESEAQPPVTKNNSFQINMSLQKEAVPALHPQDCSPSLFDHASQLDEYSQEADVEHTETSVPPEVKASTFLDRGNVEFLKSPKLESSFVTGKILEVYCTTSRTVDVAWFRNASPIHDDGFHYETWRQKRDASSVEHFLRIYDLREEDAGNYRVVAYNNEGEKWQDFRVQLTEYEGLNSLPEIFCFPDEEHTENEGSLKKFICQVKGHPEPNLVFYKDGKRLSRNENISIEYFNDFGEWSLEIRRVSPRDVGLYEVEAHNRVGSCKRSWSLKVNPKHLDPPTTKPPPIPIDLGEEEKEEIGKRPTGPIQEEEEETRTNESSESSSDNNILQAQNTKILTEAINPTLVGSSSELTTRRSSGNISYKGGEVNHLAMKMEKVETSSPASSTHNTPPGSIADREHRKWVELAVNMPNNPYSKESIEKRMKCGGTLGRGSEGGFMPKLSIDDVQEVKNDADTPSRIYCGLKSVDDSLYRRDYYINKHEDTKNSAHSTSFQKELDFEPINRSKEENNEREGQIVGPSHQDSSNGSSSMEEVKEEVCQEEEAGNISHKANMSELSNEFSSICSLNEMQDSGIGSSCERSSLLAGKVEAEILRFQKDIEKVNKEKSELLNWQMKKIEKRKKCPPKEIGPPRRYYSSMDSLLSITEDSSTSSPDPPPSVTPSAFERIISDRKIKNLNKKQVSISENSTVIISCYEDDDDRFDDSVAILPSVKKLVNKFMPSESSESEIKPSNVVKTERKSKNRFNYNNIRSSNEIHSLTARSVPRQFREGLKKGLTHFTDKNIKIPGSDTNSRSGPYGISEDDYYDDEEDSSHVIYDSKKKYSQAASSSSCNTMESTRTPSPEHVGIPASRVRLTPKKRSDVTTSYCYTSDESTNNELYEQRAIHHHPPSSRRKQIHRLSYQS